MPVKEIASTGLGHSVKFGRLRPPNRSHLHMQDYVKALPDPPPSVDYSAAAPQSMKNIYLNDRYGCCVVSDNYHSFGLMTGNAGKEFVASSAQIIADYSAIGGFNPANPAATDNGCDPEVALQHYVTHGFPDGSKLACWMAVDATNQKLVMQAIHLFESLALSIELPDRWITPFPQSSGFVWAPAGSPDPQNGHEICIYGYNSTGVLINTWALRGTITWAALAEYCVVRAGGNLYARPSMAMISRLTGKAPNGFNWNELAIDANSMGASLPVEPDPTPGPMTNARLVVLDIDNLYYSVPASGSVRVVTVPGFKSALVDPASGSMIVSDKWNAAPPH